MESSDGPPAALEQAISGSGSSGQCRSVAKMARLSQHVCAASASPGDASSGGQAPIRLLSAWFCPYAQQVRIAFLHREVQHEVVEALRWRHDDPANANQPYEKSEELLRHNPAGLVPTVVSAEGSCAVTEMLPAMELAEDLPGSGPSLMPADIWECARARTVAEWVQRRVCAAHAEVLMPGDSQRRVGAFEQLVAGLRRFGAECKGPFFSGSNFGLPDATLAPFAMRLCVLQHYLGDDFSVSRGDSTLAAFWRWYDACLEVPAVKATELSRESMIAAYQRYADGSANTKVADAIRAGTSAHDAAAGSLDEK